MSTSMSVLFLIRKDRGNDKSEAPIYMRVTIAGQRFELGTRRSVLPANWSADTGRVKGNSSAARSVNSFLESLLSKAYSHQRQILNEGKRFYNEGIQKQLDWRTSRKTAHADGGF